MGEAGLAEASRKIDTSGGGTITRVTQAVSGGRHDGFKYFRPEARAPACPAWKLSKLLSTRGDRARRSKATKNFSHPFSYTPPPPPALSNFNFSFLLPWKNVTGRISIKDVTKITRIFIIDRRREIF